MLSLLLLIPTWLLLILAKGSDTVWLSIWGNIIEFAMGRKAQVITGFMPAEWEVVNTCLLNRIDLNWTPLEAISIMTGKRRFVAITQYLWIPYYTLVWVKERAKLFLTKIFQSCGGWERERLTSSQRYNYNEWWQSKLPPSPRWHYRDVSNNVSSQGCKSMYVLGKLYQLYFLGTVVMHMNIYLSLSIVLAM